MGGAMFVVLSGVNVILFYASRYGQLATIEMVLRRARSCNYFSTCKKGNILPKYVSKYLRGYVEWSIMHTYHTYHMGFVPPTAKNIFKS